jgi:hypothetical protein
MFRTRKVQAIATTSYTGKSLATRECIFAQSPESAPDFRITTVKAATTFMKCYSFTLSLAIISQSDVPNRLRILLSFPFMVGKKWAIGITLVPMSFKFE